VGNWPEIDDREVQMLLKREVDRENTSLQLIASENFASPAVLAAASSVLTNKYAEGYPGRRYYGGNQVVDEVETLAIERAKALFGAQHANVQPHAGAIANLAAYLAVLELGDTVLAMRLDQGGHLTHGSPVNATSKLYRFVHYGVTPANADGTGERIDMDQVRDIARRERPKLIVAGATAYPRVIDPEAFRQIADEVGARFMFDAAHVAGLVAGGAHPSPVPYADLVTFTTHKTLRGPRSGVILSTAELAASVDKAVIPGLQGGPLEHIVAAKAVAFAEASTEQFRSYAAQVVANARALAGGLASGGLRIVSGGTDNHLVLVDLRDFDPDLTGKEAQEVLEAAGIVCNRNQVPGDPRSPFVTSGLRLGSAAQTTAGMGTAEMEKVASLIVDALRNRSRPEAVEVVRSEVGALCREFQPYGGEIGEHGAFGIGPVAQKVTRLRSDG
jgi:glycine hydroxymethyltransferase